MLAFSMHDVKSLLQGNRQESRRKGMEIRMNEKSKGSITIEASLVVAMCLFTLFIVMGLGMILYRQSLVAAVANQTASDIAMIYPYLDKDPNTGFTGVYDFNAPEALYRYFPWKSGKYKAENVDKAVWYARALLEQGGLETEEASEPEVHVTITGGHALRRNIEVTVTENYQIPFFEVFEIFGLPKEVEITAAASAECVDMIDFMDTTNFLNYVVDKATPLPDLFEAVDKWITWAKKIIGGGE